MNIPNNNQEKTTSISPKMSWLIVALGLITALGPLSIDMYLPAFTDIEQNLNTHIALVQYSLVSFFVGFSIVQLFYGPISDRFGRKLPMKIGFLIYIIASIGCALAKDINSLIVFRGLEALGGAAGVVITRAIVRDCFVHNHAAQAFSLLMLIMGLAPILAPIAGGYITVKFGWQAIFLFLTIYGIMCLLMLIWIPETHKTEFRLTKLNFREIFSIYIKILSDNSFLAYALPSGFIYAGMFAYITGLPFVLIDFFGIAKEHFGWFLGTNALGLISATQINRYLLNKYSYDNILKVAFLNVLITGFAAMLSSYFFKSLLILVPILFIHIGTIGFIIANATAGALTNHQMRAGSASALLGTMQFLFGALSSYVVSILHDGTAKSTTITIFACSLLAIVTYFFFIGLEAYKKHQPKQA